MENQDKTEAQFLHDVEKRTAELLKTNERLKREIEEQKRTQEALGEQKDFLNTLLETISNPVFYKDERGRYTGCNKAFESFTGRSRADIVGKTVYDMGPKEIADMYYEKDVELFENPGKQRYEWKIKNSEGELREVIFDKATLKDASGRAVGLVGVISDITERKRSEEALRNLSQLLLNAQENERQMISYELHDSIAQSLSSLKIDFDTFFDDHPAISHELKEKMTQKSELIGQVIRSVRDLSYDLHPPSLNQMGIIQTIAQLCEDFSEKTGLGVKFTPTGMSGLTPDQTLGINLYRLVQEGLNNIRKHANAKHVLINLLASHPNILLRIEDDGKGFDVKAREAAFDGEKKMGLRSMAERVGLLQGWMKIKSAPLQGTKIIIKIPFTKGKGNDA